MNFKKGLIIFAVFVCVCGSVFAQDKGDKLAQNSPLRKIEVNEDTVFFNPVDGTPLLYYFKIGSKIEFFNSKGWHPQYGGELLPVTPDIVKDYFLQEQKQVSNTTTPSNSSQPKIVFPTLTTKVTVDNVECYPEIMSNFGGIRFINHNNYNVRVYFRLTDGREGGIWVLTAGESFWTNYHYSSIVSIRVEKLI